MPVEPRYATPPTPGAPHELAQVMAVSRLIKYRDPANQLRSRELVHHQQQIARVMSERTTDRQRWRYPVVVLGLPRRTGKTVTVETIEVQRSLMYPGHASYYTAQRLTDAWQAWRELADKIHDSPVLASRVASVMSGMSTAQITWKNGALIAPFTPGSDRALDGKNSDLVTIDEAYALTEAKAELMMQSVTPTQLNRPNAQLLIVSAAGTANSTWFRRWIERGRAAIGDPDAEVAIFDYGMRDGGDPYDPDEWARFHPGYGHFTDERGMRAAMAKSTKAGFLRSYCNVWIDAQAAPFLNPDTVRELAANTQPPHTSRLTVAVEVSADGTHTTLAAAWQEVVPDHEVGTTLRLPHVAIIERGRGTEWVTASLRDLEHAGAKLIADPVGKTAVLLAGLPPDIHIHRATASEVATASQSLLLWTPTRRWRWIDNGLAGVMIDQLAHASTRTTTAGQILDPIKSTGPIDAARAAALALSHAARTPTQLQVF